MFHVALSGALKVWQVPGKMTMPPPAAVGANVPPVPAAPQAIPPALGVIEPLEHMSQFKPMVPTLCEPVLQISNDARGLRHGATSTTAVLTATGAPDEPCGLIDPA
jgi:hypothetical protein